MTTFTTEDRENASPPHIVNSGASVGIHLVKELTDGEILNMYLKQTNGNKDLDILEFARAILRKAQGL